MPDVWEASMSPIEGRVSPGMAPGGLVARCYDEDGRLVIEEIMTTEDDAEASACRHVSDPRVRRAVLFDGDTGDLVSSLTVEPL